MMSGDSGDLDRLAEALREDGVVVDVSMGSGEAQESHDRIAQLVREVPFPVYVTLVDRLPEQVAGAERGGDVHEALAALLHRRIGGEGLYVVGSPNGPSRVTAYGLDARPAPLSLLNYANQDLLQAGVEESVGEHLRVPAVVNAEATVREAAELVERAREGASGQYDPTLDEDEAAELSERAQQLGLRADWRPGSDYVEIRSASKGLSALVGTLTALGAALLLGQSLRGWPRRRSEAAPGAPVVSGPPPPPDLEAERGLATKELGRLVSRLAAAGGPPRDGEALTGALTARDTAELLMDSGDVADLIGARVLVRIGLRQLRRAERGQGTPYQPCFFDPRHPEAKEEAGWRLGQAQVRVPCCGRCHRALVKGGEPETLRVASRRGRPVPYYERDDVWARTGFGATSPDLARDVLDERRSR